MGNVGVLGTQVGGLNTAGVSGVNNGPTGIFGPQGPSQYGVWGEVMGIEPGADGVFGTVLPTTGNTGDAGVHGIAVGPSGIWGFRNLSNATGPTDYGVWGDNASATPESAGVFGTVVAPDASAAGVWGINNGPVSPPRTYSYPNLPAPIESTGLNPSAADYGVRGMTASAAWGSAGVLGETGANHTAGVYGRCTPSTNQYCYGVFSDGNMAVLGNQRVTGVKSAMIETSQGWELLYAIESPDVEFYANGTAQLEDGVAMVRFERLFREAISPDVPVRVIVTPVGSWSGLYVESQTPEGFVVRSGAGDASATFNWMAIGRRRGYEQRPGTPLPASAEGDLKPIVPR